MRLVLNQPNLLLTRYRYHMLAFLLVLLAFVLVFPFRTLPNRLEAYVVLLACLLGLMSHVGLSFLSGETQRRMLFAQMLMTGGLVLLIGAFWIDFLR